MGRLPSPVAADGDGARGVGPDRAHGGRYTRRAWAMAVNDFFGGGAVVSSIDNRLECEGGT